MYRSFLHGSDILSSANALTLFSVIYSWKPLKRNWLLVKLYYILVHDYNFRGNRACKHKIENNFFHKTHKEEPTYFVWDKFSYNFIFWQHFSFVCTVISVAEIPTNGSQPQHIHNWVRNLCKYKYEKLNVRKTA